MPRIDLDPTVQKDAWIDARAVTLAGYNQELLQAAVDLGLGLAQLQDAEDPGRLGLATPHQLALIHWQVKDWHVCNADGEPLPAPRQVTAADLALCADPVLAAVLAAIDQARSGEPIAIPDPNGPAPLSNS